MDLSVLFRAISFTLLAIVFLIITIGITIELIKDKMYIRAVILLLLILSLIFLILASVFS